LNLNTWYSRRCIITPVIAPLYPPPPPFHTFANFPPTVRTMQLYARNSRQYWQPPGNRSPLALICYMHPTHINGVTVQWNSTGGSFTSFEYFRAQTDISSLLDFTWPSGNARGFVVFGRRSDRILPRHRPSWLRFFVGFLSPSRQAHAVDFLPKPLTVRVHHWMLCCQSRKSNHNHCHHDVTSRAVEGLNERSEVKESGRVGVSFLSHSPHEWWPVLLPPSRDCGKLTSASAEPLLIKFIIEGRHTSVWLLRTFRFRKRWDGGVANSAPWSWSRPKSSAEFICDFGSNLSDVAHNFEITNRKKTYYVSVETGLTRVKVSAENIGEWNLWCTCRRIRTGDSNVQAAEDCLVFQRRGSSYGAEPLFRS
jgi:hypothetical protein